MKWLFLILGIAIGVAGAIAWFLISIRRFL